MIIPRNSVGFTRYNMYDCIYVHIFNNNNRLNKQTYVRKENQYLSIII